MTNALLDQLEETVRNVDAEALGEATVSLTHASLYEAAIEAFGGWDVALAALLKDRLSNSASRESGRSSASVERPPAPPREPHPDALRPLFVITDNAYVLRLSAEWVHAAEGGGAPRAPERFDSDTFGRIVRVADSGHLSSVLTVAGDGTVFGFDARVVPPASEGDAARRVGMRQAVERWVDIGDRDALRHAGLFVSVSRSGKVKATHNNDFPNPIHSDGTTGFLIDDDDDAVGVCVCRRDEPLLLASSNGYAIVFDISELRPQGRKATGVRGIQLRGDARVAGFLRPGEHEQIVMITAEGLGKRVFLDEFRPQSRAGLGLVALKLNSGDELAAIAGCDAVSDVLIWTNQGRMLRMPNDVVPLMGRQAKGDRVIELAPGETVAGVTGLLPMAF